MINTRFGKLVVVVESSEQTHKSKHYDCVCDCGAMHRARKDNLVSGKTLMCKQCHIETTKTHGMAGSKFYYVYKALNDRCTKPNHEAYKNYGGRGIKNLWSSFECFMKDMLVDYEDGLELDRRDNDGNYCKENCRWVSKSTNALNKRVSGKIPYRGVMLVQGKYRASVRPTGSTKMVYLGHYSTAIEAAEVYDAYCFIHCTDKQLNFNKDK